MVFQEKRKPQTLVATDFLFGPGRARREQPNGGLHLGMRAFVWSVSHVKVLVASLFRLFEILRSSLLMYAKPRKRINFRASARKKC